MPYLDYEVIANSKKRFWGYSDLTTIVNAIYTKTGRSSVLYQIRNLIYNHKEQQIADFRNTLLEGGNDLFQIKYDFIQGTQMQGVVVGGNIRCFLKLAGTEYMPELQDKILLLESYGGDVAKMETYLCQLQQLGAFDKVAGILLGTFSEMEDNRYEPDMKTLVQRIVGKELPIAVTRDIGHGTDAKAIVIGEKIELRMFSKIYNVRKLNIDDVEMIYNLCKSNTQYYEYCGKELSIELIERDLEITPPGIPKEQKYYIGFFEDSKLIAIIDLIDGYPDSNCVYIGFFMMNSELQGAGIGSKIISEVLNYAKNQGFKKCQLGIDKDNPQSNHFWRKNGFEVIREVEIEEGIILVAEKQL